MTPTTARPALHTPGPWTATRSDPAEGADVWWITSNPGATEKDIATVPGGYPREVSEANALLVAGAPELLDIVARFAMAMWQSGVSPVENSDDPLESMTFDARAALIKATGRDVTNDALESMCAVNRAEGPAT